MTEPAATPSAFRPRSAFEIIDASIQLLRRQYLQFVTIAAALYVPFIGVVAYAFPRLQAMQGMTQPSEIFGTMGPIIILYLFAFGWMLIVECAIGLAVADSYLGRPIRAGHSLRQALGRSLPILGAGILKGLLFMLLFAGVGVLAGLSALLGVFGIVLAVAAAVVGGCWLYASLFAVPLLVVFEGLGGGSSISRSMALAKGGTPRILGVLLLSWLIYGAVAVVFSLIGQLVSPLTGSLIGFIAGPFIYPMIPAVVTVLYYDMRIRKEGYDIQLLSQSLDSGAAA